MRRTARVSASTTRAAGKAWQGYAIRKHVPIQVVLVTDVRPGNLAYTGATHASEILSSAERKIRWCSESECKNAVVGKFVGFELRISPRRFALRVWKFLLSVRVYALVFS